MQTKQAGKVLQIKPSHLNGRLRIPSSKSQSLRAILFASLAKGISTITHVLPSKDVASMVNACRLMGAQINQEGDTLTIDGIGGTKIAFSDVVNAGNSGIILRFLTAIGSLSSDPFVITGDHSIRFRRPMDDMIEALNKADVTLKTLKGDLFAPLIVQGPLEKKDIYLNGIDSQPVSAFLIAAACRDVETHVHIEEPKEKPWVELTLRWLESLDVPFKASKDLKSIQVFGKSGFNGFQYQVPGDLSSLAFPVISALITQSKITIENVNLEDSQGDKKMLEILKGFGADITWNLESEELLVNGEKKLQGNHMHIEECIDALPACATLCCFMKGTQTIEGIFGARFKESNRVEAMALELEKMGAKIEVHSDSMLIHESSLHGACLESHQDHRIIMSLAAAAFGANGTSYIKDPDWIQKTYPSFIHDMQSLGAHMELI